MTCQRLEKSKVMKKVLGAVAALCLAPAAMAQNGEFQEGVNYQLIESPSPIEDGRVEVVEVFSYACPHCAQFQPYVSRWEEDLPEYVDFRRVPAVFQPSWEPFAQAYHTANVLGIVEEGHEAMFAALHEERRRMRTLDDLAEFWSDYGVSADEFKSTAGSFAVDTRMRQGRTEAGRWRISGTPSMIVNGKYRVGAGREFPGNQTFDDIVEVVDYLVALEAPADAEPEATGSEEQPEEETAAEEASDS